jgi:LPXTG-motif cell wall-anchored protein
LPKTASELNLIGLIGLLSAATGYVTRFFRS